ncbi:hypothetical protein ABMA58_11735 [Oceanospirillum sp. HFRX-1_2]
MDIWINRLEIIINIIRPKAYNTIAKMVVGLGCTIIATSQINIIQVFGVAAFEDIFGKSDWLRDTVSSESNLWVGSLLVLSGLIYHLLVTVLKELVESKLALLPKEPILEAKILNSDLKDINIKYKARGCLVDIPDINEIPDYEVDKGDSQLSRILSTMEQVNTNPNYLRERAKFIKTWAGSELITIELINLSDVIATGVIVELKFPKVNGVSSKTTNSDYPKTPKKNNPLFRAPYENILRNESYDIIDKSNKNEYCFSWKIGDLQANTEKKSNTLIFIRTEKSITIDITTYCDQLISPNKRSVEIIQEKDVVSLTYDETTSCDLEFARLTEDLIMDGYLQRKIKQRIKEYEHKSQVHLP